jgi:hypothetical protein
MKRTAAIHLGLALGLALLHHVALAQPGQPPQQPQPVQPELPKQKIIPELPPFSKFSKAPEVIQRLQTEFDTKGFHEPMPLGEALALVDELLAARKKEVALLFDAEAFRAEAPKPKLTFTFQPEPPKKEPPDGKPEPGILDTKVTLPLIPRKLTADLALRLFLSQLTDYQGTYIIRNGTVLLTTKNRGSVKNLLKEKVAASFHQTPLFEAIYKLSDQVGASVVIDPKFADRAFTPVTATFVHDATLESALTLLTDMAGLRLAVIDNGIYVTSPQNADKIRYLPRVN